MPYQYCPGGGMWFFPLLIFAGFAVLAVLFFFLFGKKCFGPWRYPGERETALDILEKRYAKGEISKEEFEQMKKDISQ